MNAIDSETSGDFKKGLIAIGKYYISTCVLVIVIAIGKYYISTCVLVIAIGKYYISTCVLVINK